MGKILLTSALLTAMFISFAYGYSSGPIAVGTSSSRESCAIYGSLVHAHPEDDTTADGDGPRYHLYINGTRKASFEDRDEAMAALKERCPKSTPIQTVDATPANSI